MKTWVFFGIALGNLVFIFILLAAFAVGRSYLSLVFGLFNVVGAMVMLAMYHESLHKVE